jgi:hypothetical protein
MAIGKEIRACVSVINQKVQFMTQVSIKEDSMQEQQRARQMAELEALLAELIAMGVVLEERGKAGRTRYDVNQQTLSEMGAPRIPPSRPTASVNCI